MYAGLPHDVEVVVEAHDDPARCHHDHHHLAFEMHKVLWWRVEVAGSHRKGSAVPQEDGGHLDVLLAFLSGKGEASLKATRDGWLDKVQLEVVRDEQDFVCSIAVQVCLHWKVVAAGKDSPF